MIKDLTVFEKVDTPAKAYLLGFIIADGNSDGKYKITIVSKDLEILHKCKKILKCDNKISSQLKKNINETKAHKIYYLQICSQKLVSDLRAFGIEPRKSWTSTFPDIKEEYYSHFLRGLFDGDGSICFLKKNNSPRFSIIGSENLIKVVQKILCNKCGVPENKLSLCQEKNNNKIIKILYGGRFHIIKILDFLYSDSDNSTRLNRKYMKYIKVKKIPIKEKRKDSVSKYIGVGFRGKNYKVKWAARLDQKKLGYFEKEIDAAICYNTECFKKYNDKNRLNVISNRKH